MHLKKERSLFNVLSTTKKKTPQMTIRKFDIFSPPDILKTITKGDVPPSDKAQRYQDASLLVDKKKSTLWKIIS